MRTTRHSDRIALALALGAAALLVGCVARQQIPLDQCIAEKMTIYVDGRLLEPGKELELTTNIPHKLFFKHPGLQSHLIVLEPTPDPAGGRRAVLQPEDPCQQVLAVGLDRSLQLEVDESEIHREPAPGSTQPSREPSPEPPESSPEP